MALEQRVPPPPTRSRWVVLRRLLQVINRLKAGVRSAGVPQSGMNGTVTLTFSRPPEDLTQHMKGKQRYAHNIGGFSDVYKCMLDKPGEPSTMVAVKGLRLSASDAKDLEERGKKLRGEVHIWIRLDHPNVLKLCGLADGFSPLPALVSPWVENGTLTTFLVGPGQEISKRKRISILVKVGEALHYIHSEHVVHGDLTGSNILINGKGQPLISDFGLSSILEDYNETSYFKSHTPGAFRWVAPELLADLQTSPKPSIESDAYSYGCVMLHTLSGKVPYSEIRDIHVPHTKINGGFPGRPADLPIEETHWEMIEHCIDNAPRNRPKLPDIISFLSR
ncbi:hypothetical protein PAXRUDRAFT_832833 [Paxillus rubicundulus Ve08.2h10]|uniref:Protein kinase domain-containing protein n=1 Tax=Paxillus rubicundulus Ve08.2h10 TaxID=930991 RepID=A0A0D0CFL3_9AGAM|nr:hypothetical protein PAXRUDRAFT_832833 [Paxillus rubicundulus Ve08.2h10]